jgi:6-phosphogluconolactonase
MIELHAFDTAQQQITALADAVAKALGMALSGPTQHATLAVSGGNSPREMLKVLSREAIDWARIDVTLVDDRWVPADDPDSNTRLVGETLLQNSAKSATFFPLVDASREPREYVAALNGDARRAKPDVAILGMGENAHTASLFVDSPEWHHSITTHEHFVLVHSASAPHPRVTWSLSALSGIERLFLLIAGQAKLDVLKRAVESPQENGISKLANNSGVKLEVYWCE